MSEFTTLGSLMTFICEVHKDKGNGYKPIRARYFSAFNWADAQYKAWQWCKGYAPQNEWFQGEAPESPSGRCFWLLPLNGYMVCLEHYA